MKETPKKVMESWAQWKKDYKITHYTQLKDGVPCGHPGCLNHVTHPCEGCGRVAGRFIKKET